jgi:hypothetical protein
MPVGAGQGALEANPAGSRKEQKSSDLAWVAAEEKALVLSVTMTQRQDNIKPSWISNNIVSPYGLAAISYAFFLFACLIPPSFYSHYMGEPDLMFLDPATIMFYTLCVLSFVAGVAFIEWIYPSTFWAREHKCRALPVTVIVVPLGLSIVVGFLSIVYVVTHYPSIMLALMMQQGGKVKNTISLDVSDHFAFIPLILIGVTWWAYWRYHHPQLTGVRRVLIAFLLVLAVLCVVCLSIVTLSRNIAMLALCGLAILYALDKSVKLKVTAKFAIKRGFIAAILFVLLFFSFSFLRGSNDWDDQVSTLFGYTIASYNRLAAIVNHQTQYPFGGRGIYLSDVVAHNHLLGIGKLLNVPNSIDEWGSEFAAISNAGLDGALIWSGAFGYIFSDLGWFAFLFLWSYGIIYGIIWNRMKRDTAFAVIVYPCFGFSVLFWFGTNYLLSQPLEILTCTAVCISIYESAVAIAKGKCEINPRR